MYINAINHLAYTFTTSLGRGCLLLDEASSMYERTYPDHSIIFFSIFLFFLWQLDDNSSGIVIRSLWCNIILLTHKNSYNASEILLCDILEE